jgi:hypothetical protein
MQSRWRCLVIEFVVRWFLEGRIEEGVFDDRWHGGRVNGLRDREADRRVTLAGIAVHRRRTAACARTLLFTGPVT